MPCVPKISGSYGYIPPAMPHSPLEPIKPKIGNTTYYKDSIASKDVANWVWGLASREYKLASTIKSLGSRPQLAPPDQIDTKELLVANNELIDLIECMKTQREIYEVDGKLSHQMILKRKEINHELQKNYFSQYDELIKRAKHSKNLDWANKILTGGLIFVGCLSVGLAIFTGGASLIAIPTALLAVSQGGVGIAKGVLDYQNGKQTGVMFGLKERRMMNQEKIKQGMREIKQSVDTVNENWSQLRQILENIYQTSMNTLK